MSTAASYNLVSVEEYLQGELQSDVRHEYLGGVVYAMVGGTNAHGMISLNCAASLHTQLKGKPCDAFGSDTKIRMSIQGQPRYYYPDVSVTCEPNPPSDTFQDNPLLIIEVLSASTRRLDDGEKREAYFTLPSLRYYILLEQHTMGAVFYRRDGDDWERTIHTDPDSGFHFSEIGAELRFRDAYASVEI